MSEIQNVTPVLFFVLFFVFVNRHDTMEGSYPHVPADDDATTTTPTPSNVQHEKSRKVSTLPSAAGVQQQQQRKKTTSNSFMKLDSHGTYLDQEKDSGGSSGGGGWREWPRNNPRKSAAIACCCILLIILLIVGSAIVAVLLPLRDADLRDGTTVAELFSVCDVNNIDFQVSAKMDNPATINTELRDFDMRISEGGKLIASSRVPGFPLQPGSVKFDIFDG